MKKTNNLEFTKGRGCKGTGFQLPCLIDFHVVFLCLSRPLRYAASCVKCNVCIHSVNPKHPVFFAFLIMVLFHVILHVFSNH